MNIILLGCPGAGKGTQAKILTQKYHMTHISTGNIFRDEMAHKTDLGKKVEQYVNSGRLVPDAVVVELVSARLQNSPNGFLLDGFPRTLEQAQALDAFLLTSHLSIDAVIYMRLGEAAVIQRLSARRQCKACGEVYNLVSHPPKAPGICDVCGGTLIQRDDDMPGTVQKRLMVYNDLTDPLVAYYKSNQAFYEVDAAQTPEQVSSIIFKIVEETVP
ncbi:MAG: adenylate kinase [Elusimicrobia bacterium]|nr:adenylate kinase [Elusimicrobiota bacterium]